MLEIIEETLLDSVKLLPFLFIAFLIIELIEHKLSNKSKKLITKSDKFGPIIGGVLGVIPQCGFSVMATNLYVTRIISLGTLISVYLSTSDEMLPILLSSKTDISIILKIIFIKLIIGIISGIVIDFAIRKSKKKITNNYEICDEEHCHCEKNILLSVIVHTLKTFFFIMIITFILNFIFHYIGEEFLTKIFLKNSIFGPFLASIIGLIPNCAASVMITELYLNNAISLGSTIAGLLTGSGVALLVLFKSNKSLKENLSILLLIYFIGAFSGLIIQLIEMII